MDFNNTKTKKELSYIKSNFNLYFVVDLIYAKLIIQLNFLFFHLISKILNRDYFLNFLFSFLSFLLSIVLYLTFFK